MGLSLNLCKAEPQLEGIQTGLLSLAEGHSSDGRGQDHRADP